MQPTFTFRNIEATDALRQHSLDKIHHLEKYFHKPQTLHVILSVEGLDHRAEVTLHDGGQHFVSHSSSENMYASIDQAIHKLTEQLRRHKEKKTHHKGNASAVDISYEG